MTDDQPAGFRIGYRTATLSIGVVALAAIATAVVVTSLRDADTLSVVALALAIISFVIQIILFIVQQASSANDARRSADLYAQTIRALASIEEKAEGTKQTVTQMNEQLLRVALTKATAEEAESGQSHPTSSREYVDRVVQRASEIVSSPAPASVASVDAGESRPRHSFLDRKIDDSMTEAALVVARELKGIELTTIRRLARDQAVAEREGDPDRAGMSTINEPKALHAKGLITRKRVDWSRDPIYRLTPLGRDVARILLSKQFDHSGNEDVQKVRAVLRHWDDGLSELQKRMREEDNQVPVDE